MRILGDLRRPEASTWRECSRRARPSSLTPQSRQSGLSSGKRSFVLGISAYYHDSAVALVADGMIVAAAQEERFTRIKQDASFPKNALRYCLDEAGISLSDVSLIVYYENPLIKFRRLWATFVQFAPNGNRLFRAAMPNAIKRALRIKRKILSELQEAGLTGAAAKRILCARHHLSHAASAFLPSPFAEAAILTVDGVGEKATTTLAFGRGNSITLLKEIQFPHSLGLFYSAFTVYCGFRVNSGEYKLMGLAPYGTARFRELLMRHVISLNDDGSFTLNMDLFEYGRSPKMFNEKLSVLLGKPPRQPNEPLDQHYMDVAASVQAVLEDALISLASYASRTTGSEYLCLAGGVALNCVANTKLLKTRLFKEIWVQPASGDAGTAVGAALLGSNTLAGQRRAGGMDAMNYARLGPKLKPHAIRSELCRMQAVYTEHSEVELCKKVAATLADGKAVGWVSGRMEFGPRALGGRSILADPRAASMQSILNLKIKNRESFRPFAPIVLTEDASDWFDVDIDNPYMLFVGHVKEKHRISNPKNDAAINGIRAVTVARSTIPAATHLDYSARFQTVSASSDPLLHRLLTEFKMLTGIGVLINTSFNVRGEPIVCTTEDAFRCFMTTELDMLVVAPFLLEKDQQRTVSQYARKAVFPED